MTHLNEQIRPVSSRVKVNYAICHFCGACVGACPENCMFLRSSHLAIDNSTCTVCQRCIYACPLRALSLAEGQLEPA